MTRSFILALLLCATAQAQFMPVGFWKTASVAAWTPKSLDSLSVWLAADSITGKAAGDTLYAWRDLSGNGYHAYQLTAGSKPIYRTDSLNGKPCVVFDGSDDRMQTPVITYGGPQNTIVLVYSRHKYIDAAGGLVLEHGANAPANGQGFYIDSYDPTSVDSSKATFFVSGNQQSYGFYCVQKTSMQIGPHIIVGSISGDADINASADVRTDWAACYRLAIGGYSWAARLATRNAELNIGARASGSYAANISIYEIIITRKALSASDWTALQSYFNTKYGI